MKLLKTSLLIISCLVGIALIVAGAAIVWLLFIFSPTSHADIVRDATPSTIAVTFQVIPCGDGTASMRLPPETLDTVGPGLEIAVPPGLPHPEEWGDVGVSGNRFILTGYLSRYHTLDEDSNIKTIGKPFRIDLISWEIVAPYKVWTHPTEEEIWANLENEEILTKTQNTPLRFTAPTALPQQAFTMPKYSGC